MYNQSDDLKYAIESNSLDTFLEEEIVDIVAEVPGSNDEFSWWWVLQLTKDRFALVSGWCDYTGWDCQSGITEHGIYSTALKAAKESPEIEKYSDRNIRKNLVGQLKGKFPKFTYWED